MTDHPGLRAEALERLAYWWAVFHVLKCCGVLVEQLSKPWTFLTRGVIWNRSLTGSWSGPSRNNATGGTVIQNPPQFEEMTEQHKNG